MKKIVIFLCVFFISCSYKPVGVATRDILGDNVFIWTVINKEDPRNSIVLNDNFTNYVQNYLQKNITSRENADSIIELSLKNLKFIALYYDEFGYARSYKTILELEFIIQGNDGNKKVVKTSGEYVFNTNTISVISEEQKSKAIELASKRAFNEFAVKILI